MQRFQRTPNIDTVGADDWFANFLLKLVDDANDILDELKLPARATPTRDLPELEGDEASLLNQLGHSPCDLDVLCARAQVGADLDAGLLLRLELKGLVESLPGNRYQRVR